MPKYMITPTQEQLMDAHVDITQPAHGVEVRTNSNGVLWVNVDGVCVLRVCRVEHLEINGDIQKCSIPFGSSKAL